MSSGASRDGGDLLDLIEKVDRQTVQQLGGEFGVQALGVPGEAVVGAQRGPQFLRRVHRRPPETINPRARVRQAWRSSPPPSP
ncbi:hypothetical protein [Kitasatospora sp. NPDC002965]|uniref:hypothetical protein n=1 Tax=Kitasatospora sp. NPDC002965 TaxID=3154775 RepID=UPI0033B74308